MTEQALGQEALAALPWKAELELFPLLAAGPERLGIRI